MDSFGRRHLIANQKNIAQVWLIKDFITADLAHQYLSYYTSHHIPWSVCKGQAKRYHHLQVAISSINKLKKRFSYIFLLFLLFFRYVMIMFHIVFGEMMGFKQA